MDRLQKLQDMLTQQPGDPFLRHAMALEYMKTGDDERARELFAAILAEDPGYVGSYYHLAGLLARMGRTAEAIAVCEAGLAACRQAGDDHAWRELNAVYEDLTY